MRARFARPRRIVRGRLVAPVAAAAAVALVGGVVVATPDAPTVREDVQTVATVLPGFKVGAEASYNLNGIAWGGSLSGFEVTDVTGLPGGLTFENGVIIGKPTESGVFNLEVFGNLGGQVVTYPVQLVVNLEDGSAPAGFEAGSSTLVQGSLGTEAEAEAQVVTGSEGADSLLSAVASIVASLGGDAGSVTELVTGSTGGTENPDAPGTPSGPLGSVSDSLLGSTPTHPDLPPEEQTPGSSFPGSSTTGEAGGEVKVGHNIEGELTVPGSSIPGSSIPGSSTTGTTGSLGDLAPGLALTGAALLGIAGLSLVLGGGSSTPGSSIPGLLGSSTTGGSNTTTGGSSTGAGPSSSTGPGGSSGPGSSTSRPGGSSGSVAPTVAAGSPKRAEAPGPTVANGRG